MNPDDTPRPCCLTIAGSDSGGNAGIQADLRAFHAYGVHGCTVFTALTAQNPHGVSAVLPVPSDFVAAQLDAVIGTYAINAIKTGMMPGVATVRTVAERIAPLDGVAKVVDPVMVATSGARLADDGCVAAMKAELLPLATLVTPNIPEASVLAGVGIACRADAEEAARRIHGAFGCAVLVKGGHAVGDIGPAEDALFDGREFRRLSLPPVERPVSTHGTGCTLSAAIAAALATGRSLADAVAYAKAYVRCAIADSYLVGPSCGVLGF